MSTDDTTGLEGTRDRKSAGLTRRASIGLFGVAGLGALTGVAAAAPPDDQDNQPFYRWERDVDAQGHALSNVGTLAEVGAITGAGSVAMANNATAITDFAGDNLEIDGDGMLNATVPTAVGGFPFVEDANSPYAFTGAPEHTISLAGEYDRVWLLIDYVDFDATSEFPGAGLLLTKVNGIDVPTTIPGPDPGPQAEAFDTTGTMRSTQNHPLLGAIGRASGFHLSGTLSMNGRWPEDMRLNVVGGAEPLPGRMTVRAVDWLDTLAPPLESIGVTNVPSPLSSLTLTVVGSDSLGTPVEHDFEIRGRLFGDTAPVQTS